MFFFVEQSSDTLWQTFCWSCREVFAAAGYVGTATKCHWMRWAACAFMAMFWHFAELDPSLVGGILGSCSPKFHQFHEDTLIHPVVSNLCSFEGECQCEDIVSPNYMWDPVHTNQVTFTLSQSVEFPKRNRKTATVQQIVRLYMLQLSPLAPPLSTIFDPGFQALVRQHRLHSPTVCPGAVSALQWLRIVGRWENPKNCPVLECFSWWLRLELNWIHLLVVFAMVLPLKEIGWARYAWTICCWLCSCRNDTISSSGESWVQFLGEVATLAQLRLSHRYRVHLVPLGGNDCYEWFQA